MNVFSNFLNEKDLSAGRLNIPDYGPETLNDLCPECHCPGFWNVELP